MRCITHLVMVTALLGIAPTTGADEAVAKGPLWAAIGVNRPLFVEGHLRGEPANPKIDGEVNAPLVIHFVLVNDGNKVVNPDIASSMLMVNGSPAKDWVWTISSGPRPANYGAVSPGESLEFVIAMGKQFDKAGIYKVLWKGTSFQSPEIVFRVLHKNKK